MQSVVGNARKSSKRSTKRTICTLIKSSQIRMPRWSRGRVALIGDAACCVSLLAGQGSALAMISAYVLARELTRTGNDHRKAFAAYEARLRAFIERKQRAAERFASAFAPRTKLGVGFRNLVVRALGVPGIARLVVGRDIVDRIETAAMDVSETTAESQRRVSGQTGAQCRMSWYPTSIRELIQHHIDSVAQLEALLLLRAHPRERWDAHGHSHAPVRA